MAIDKKIGVGLEYQQPKLTPELKQIKREEDAKQARIDLRAIWGIG